MERQKVQSSHLRSVGYSSENDRLEVEFENGRVYQYFDVPTYMYNDLMKAASKGSFFNQHIRDDFEYDRVE